jgi:type VI secretion system protein ImpC
LLDATLDELLADPAALRNILISHREPWSLLVGNFVFSDSAADVRRLSTLGALARGAGAPFLAEAQPPAGDAGEEWQQLRRTPIARSLGLVLPRFLLRLPYGKKTTPIETFPFEEMQGSVHAEYLWGNPAFCCAYLIAQAGEPGPNRRLDGLPLHIVGSETKPCAEVLLSEKDAEYLMDLGFMPLASMKDQDAVLLVRFQSIAEPLAALAGRWSE